MARCPVSLPVLLLGLVPHCVSLKNGCYSSLVTVNVISGTSPASLKEATRRSSQLLSSPPSILQPTCHRFGFITMRQDREQGLEIWVLVLGKGKLRLKHEAQAPARLFQIPFWGLRS